MLGWSSFEEMESRVGKAEKGYRIDLLIERHENAFKSLTGDKQIPKNIQFPI